MFHIACEIWSSVLFFLSWVRSSLFPRFIWRPCRPNIEDDIKIKEGDFDFNRKSSFVFSLTASFKSSAWGKTVFTLLCKVMGNNTMVEKNPQGRGRGSTLTTVKPDQYEIQIVVSACCSRERTFSSATNWTERSKTHTALSPVRYGTWATTGIMSPGQQEKRDYLRNGSRKNNGRTLFLWSVAVFAVTALSVRMHERISSSFWPDTIDVTNLGLGPSWPCLPARAHTLFWPYAQFRTTPFGAADPKKKKESVFGLGSRIARDGWRLHSWVGLAGKSGVKRWLGIVGWAENAFWSVESHKSRIWFNPLRPFLP